MVKHTVRPRSDEAKAIALKLFKAKDSKCFECSVRLEPECSVELEPGHEVVIESMSEIKICTDTRCSLYPIVWVPILKTMGYVGNL
ncbi:MAG: hypothetical protein HOI47_24320 [Candidatus Scalindua sp.]|jgi:hypothetical protein|nr:hypothetical protein [Candidatus Scalindua sp.]MBT5303772.1 hypothetical protein [Candidatus Scalindua sp.]MBT6051174.1 hypothetical protein [Candidatus Scalindua sp.]MBT6229780.1 hypothetical protein [Candidatus Scalindua sp.]